MHSSHKHLLLLLLHFFFTIISSSLLSCNVVNGLKPAQYLRPHNEARAAVGLPPLVWDARLAGYANRYADQRRGDCRLVHSHGPFGENLFWGSGTGWSPAQAVGAWVQERQRYNYWTNSCRGVCGHYTQIVWRNTKRLGCAMVNCFNRRGTFVVCSYDPAGNYVGVKPY